MTPEIVVAGDLFIDLILSGFPHWPRPGTEAFATEFRREIGGGTAITACGLARLSSCTSVMGVVGRDYGEWAVERLKSFGVMTWEMQFDPVEPTAFTVAITTPADRTFLTYPGSNRSFGRILAEAVAAGRFAKVRHLHLAWVPPLDSADDLLSRIRSQGCSVSLDTGWSEEWLADPRALNLLSLVDVFFPNEMEAQRMTGETDPERSLRRFHEAGARGVALKLGSEGAALLWHGEIFRVKKCEVQPVDTIGAGDSFDAGFLHYWLRGASPLTCLQAGNFCGAASTESYGGVEAFPDAGRVASAINRSSCEK